jgi:hypothetical protein
LRGIDEDFAEEEETEEEETEEEIPQAEAAEDSEVEAAAPVEVELPDASGASEATVSDSPSQPLPDPPARAARPPRDRPSGAGKPATTTGKPANMSKSVSSGGSQSKKSSVKKGSGR